MTTPNPKASPVPAAAPAPGVGPARATLPAQTTATVPAPAAEPEPPLEISEPAAKSDPEEPPPPPLKITGTFFTRYELREGYGEIGATGGFQRRFDTDSVAYRARMGLTSAPISLGDGFQSFVMFEPQAAGFIATSGGLADPGLGLHQGTLNLVAPSYRLQVGRFEMTYGEHLMIGNVGWHETGRAFDGARVHIAPEDDGAWGDIFMTVIDEGADGVTNRAIGVGDHYFAGAYVGVGPAIGALEWDLYMLSRFWLGGTFEDDAMMTSESVDPAAELTFGSRLKGNAGIADYRAEGGLQAGARKAAASDRPRDVLALQIDAELGVAPTKGLRLAMAGFFASGDDASTDDKDEGWNQLYPTAHKFLGLADIIGFRSNVAGGALKFSYAFTPAVKLGIDAQMFLRPEPVGGETGYAATEVDTGLVYLIGPGLTARAMYALFVPNKDLYGNDEPAHFLEVEIKQAIK